MDAQPQPRPTARRWLPALLGLGLQAGLYLLLAHTAARQGVLLPLPALLLPLGLTQAPDLLGRPALSLAATAALAAVWGAALPGLAAPVAALAGLGLLAQLALFPLVLTLPLAVPLALAATGLGAAAAPALFPAPALAPALPTLLALLWALRVYPRLRALPSTEAQAGLAQAEAALAGAREACELAVAERTRALAGANARLQESNARLEAAQAARVRAYRALGHELRAPLTAIRGLAEALAAALQADPEAQADLAAMGHQADALLALVDDLLLLARAEDGTLPTQPQRLDLAAVVEDALGAQQALLAPGVRLVPRLAPCPALLDPRDAGQIVANLLSNAVKYTRVGAVAVTTRVEDGEARLGVVDSGPGIPEEALGTLFEPFGTVAGIAPREGFGSTGLGLAVVKALVAGAGGEVRVQSRVGQGSAFWVSFPAAGDGGRGEGAGG